MIFIGIDPGVKTGIAAMYSESKIHRCETLNILHAMEFIKKNIKYDALDGFEPHHIFIEDARLCKYFGKHGDAARQGVGYVKAHCAIWEDFCNMYRFKYTMIDPRHNKMKKINDDQFKSITGWKGRTSEHARDAAMLIYGIK